MAKKSNKRRKNKPKRKPRRRPARRPVDNASSTPIARSSSSDPISRTEERFATLRKHHGTAKALAFLDKTLPRDSEAPNIERLALLARRLSERAVEELLDQPSALDDRKAVGRIAVMALTLPLDVPEREALSGLDHPVARDLLTAISARRLIEEGLDDEAKALLGTIGIRSALRSVKLFLSGLIDYYNGDLETAHKRFVSLIGKDSLDVAARSFALACAVGAGDWDSPVLDTDTPPSTSLLDPRQRSHLALARAHRALERDKPKKAADILEAVALSGDTGMIEVMRRDLVLAGVAKGYEETDIAVDLVGRSIHLDGVDPAFCLGPIMEATHAFDAARYEWHSFIELLDFARPLPESAQRERFGALIDNLKAEVFDHLARLRGHRDGRWTDHIHDFEFWRMVEFYDDLDCEWSKPHKQILGYLEEAVRLRPRCQDYWVDLVEATFALRPKARHAKIVERFVKAMPESPRALRFAAEAAVARRAYDKAQRYIERAVESSPADRSLRALQCRALLGKGDKKLTQGRVSDARELYRRATSTPHLDPQVSSVALARLAAFHHLHGDPSSRDDAQLRLEATVKTPWGGLLRRYLAESEIIGLTPEIEESVQERFREAPRLPSVPPTREDLRNLFALLDIGDSLSPPGALLTPPKLDIGWIGTPIEAVIEALVRGIAERIDDATTALRATRVVFSLETKHLLAARARFIDPNAPLAIALYYSTALEIDAPEVDFNAGLQEMEALIRRLSNPSFDRDAFLPSDDNWYYLQFFRRLMNNVKAGFKSTPREKPRSHGKSDPRDTETLPLFPEGDDEEISR